MNNSLLKKIDECVNEKEMTEAETMAFLNVSIRTVRKYTKEAIKEHLNKAAFGKGLVSRLGMRCIDCGIRFEQPNNRPVVCSSCNRHRKSQHKKRFYESKTAIVSGRLSKTKEREAEKHKQLIKDAKKKKGGGGEVL